METKLHALILPCFELKMIVKEERRVCWSVWAVGCLIHVWEVLGTNIGTQSGNPDGCFVSHTGIVLKTVQEHFHPHSSPVYS